ncbi:hypothetical protein [Rhodococcus pyridinivorans]|uniref:Uncharacterized protein n=1 Tax=Rhodococcus pyridinivorans TaxID=103816 RepID=A0A7M2XIS5_9NOCA|nr:hypothetical protein [Rhodococcus pyridinivorans]QOV97605.1 hypothetical protein INP59_16915 [Rhodococcus pyridinivorans]
MRTFDAANWQPRELVAPDGRRFTPSSRAEEGELLARKYRVADPEQGQDVPQTAQVPVADAAPESVPQAATESVVEDVPADLDPDPEPDAAEPAPARPRRRKPAAAETPAETAADTTVDAAPVADTQEEQL